MDMKTAFVLTAAMFHGPGGIANRRAGDPYRTRQSPESKSAAIEAAEAKRARKAAKLKALAAKGAIGEIKGGGK